MTATAANLNVQVQAPGLDNHGVGAGIHIYIGSACYIEASDGFITDTDNSGANKFAGIAEAEADNTGGADGDIDVDVRSEGVFRHLVGASLTQADVGKAVYGSDNQTFTKTASGSSYMGWITEYISATAAAVQIDVMHLPATT